MIRIDMPVGEGYRNIPLRRNLVIYFMNRWEDDREKHADRTHKEFGGFVNDILEKLAKKEEYVREIIVESNTIGLSLL